MFSICKVPLRQLWILLGVCSFQQCDFFHGMNFYLVSSPISIINIWLFSLNRSFNFFIKFSLDVLMLSKWPFSLLIWLIHTVIKLFYVTSLQWTYLLVLSIKDLGVSIPYVMSLRRAKRQLILATFLLVGMILFSII